MRGLRVQDAAGSDGTDNARYPDYAKLLVDLDLVKDRRMGVV